MHGPDEVLLLGQYARVERVAMPAVLGLRFLVFGPDFLGHPLALLLELLLGRDDAAHLADGVLRAGLGLVPEEAWVIVRNVTIVTPGAHAGAVRKVHALLVLVRDPLHRVTGTAAEFVASRCGDHDLRRDD